MLVIATDRQVPSTLRAYLQPAGLRVLEAADMETGLLLAQYEKPALIVVDPALLHAGDSNLMHSLLHQQAAPVTQVLVLFLVAGDGKVKSTGDVLAHVEALQRRLQESPPPQSAAVVAGGLHIDPASRMVQLDGKNVPLTAVEFDLLLIFVHSPGRPFTRAELFKLLQSTAPVQASSDVRTIDAHIKNLRRKLNSAGRTGRFIETVHGIGYRFVA